MFKSDIKLNFIKIISLILVVISLVSTKYVSNYISIDKSSYIIALIFNTLSKIGLPMFFMVTGAILLNKDYNRKKNFIRIKKVILYIILFAIIYYLFDKYIMYKQNLSFLKYLFNPDNEILKFNYSLLFIYITLPFIKSMTDNMNRSMDRLFIICFLVLIGLVNAFRLTLPVEIPIFAGAYYFGYFVIGYIIYKYRNRFIFNKRNYIFLTIFILSFLSLFGSTLFMSNTLNIHYDNLIDYKNILVMTEGISLYILLYNNFPDIRSDIIKFISKHVHITFMLSELIFGLILKYFNVIKVNSVIGIPYLSMVVLVFSFMIGLLMKKIPLFETVFNIKIKD